MRVDFQLRLCLCLLIVVFAQAISLSKNQKQQGIVDSAVRNGDSVPTSSTTRIAQQSEIDSDSVLDRVGTITFGDDLQSNSDNARQNLRAAPLTDDNQSVQQSTTLHRSASISEMEPVRWGDPEAFNQRAIHRVAADIPDLLKKVDAAIPMYTRRVLTDYYDEPTVRSHGHAADESNISLLEVGVSEAEEFARFQSMGLRDRVRMLEKKKYDLEHLRDSIQLELHATTKLQDRLRSSAKDSAVSRSRAPQPVSRELRESDELASLNPQLKEWADDARFSQSKREIGSLLDKSSQFLDSFKHRLASDYSM